MHRWTFRFCRISLFTAVMLVASGCAFNRQASVAFDGCWADNPPTDYIVRAAANSIIADPGAGGPRIRALAAVPLRFDSIRAHGRLVTDATTCARVWRALDPSDRTSRIAVVQIGRTYWVRLPHGFQAYDDELRLLTSIVDL